MNSWLSPQRRADFAYWTAAYGLGSAAQVLIVLALVGALTLILLSVAKRGIPGIVKSGQMTSLTFTVSPSALLPGTASHEPTDSTTPSTGNPPLTLSFTVLAVLVLGALSAWWLEVWRRSRSRQ